MACIKCDAEVRHLRAELERANDVRKTLSLVIDCAHEPCSFVPGPCFRHTKTELERVTKERDDERAKRAALGEATTEAVARLTKERDEWVRVLTQEKARAEHYIVRAEAAEARVKELEALLENARPMSETDADDSWIEKDIETEMQVRELEENAQWNAAIDAVLEELSTSGDPSDPYDPIGKMYHRVARIKK